MGTRTRLGDALPDVAAILTAVNAYGHHVDAGKAEKPTAWRGCQIVLLDDDAERAATRALLTRGPPGAVTTAAATAATATIATAATIREKTRDLTLPCRTNAPLAL